MAVIDAFQRKSSNFGSNLLVPSSGSAVQGSEKSFQRIISLLEELNQIYAVYHLHLASQELKEYDAE
jgi:hypothetical protein